MNSARIIYTSRSDATTEGEVAALANVYKFILNCHANRNAVGITDTNDTILRNAEEVSDVEQRPD
jgi:hypothetical protein